MADISLARSRKLCTIEGCMRYLHARNLCKAHYETSRRYGTTPRPGPVRRHKYGPLCSVEGCGAEHDNNGYCAAHAMRNRRYGSPTGQPTGRKIRGPSPCHPCSIDGCIGHGRTKGLCPAHYQRLLRYGDPLMGGMLRTKKPPECKIEGCSSVVVSRSLCSAHYSTWRRLGDPLAKSEWAKKREGKLIDPDGYVHVYDPDHPNKRRGGRVPEHRHVMSKIIGRPLLTSESVHHKNGVITYNDPSNLELWVTSQPAGQRPADLVAWAKEILRTYPDELVSRLGAS